LKRRDQVRLVVEAELGRHIGQRLAAEDAVARGLKATSQDVRGRRDAEDRREGTSELRRGGADRHSRGSDRHLLEDVSVEECAELLSVVPASDGGAVGWRLAKRGRDPLGDVCRPRLRLEGIVSAGERVRSAAT
jgi:hypothetical protein